MKIVGSDGNCNLEGLVFLPNHSNIAIDSKQVAVEHEVTTPHHIKDHPSMSGPSKKKNDVNNRDNKTKS